MDCAVVGCGNGYWNVVIWEGDCFAVSLIAAEFSPSALLVVRSRYFGSLFLLLVGVLVGPALAHLFAS